MVGAIVGLVQFRIKRLLAYSTISHVGFLLLALTVQSTESIQAFIFYLMQYSLSNINIFFIIILIGYSLAYYVNKKYDMKEETEMENSPAGGCGKPLLWEQWPNSGDLLKLLIPNYIRKAISGRSNYPCMVISQKMIEREMDNRGSKSYVNVINLTSVKEQRVDGH